MVKILIYFFDVAGAWTGIDFRFIENINSSLDNCVHITIHFRRESREERTETKYE